MLNTILSWFGLGKKKPKYTKKSVRPSQYYRRGGRFYSTEDNSLIEDLLLLEILMDYYHEGAITVTESFADPAVGDIDSVDIPTLEDRVEPTVDIWKEEETEDILDMDVDTIPVERAETRESITERAADLISTPESTKSSSYSSGYSDSDSSSSYDSGSSDCGGCGGD